MRSLAKVVVVALLAAVPALAQTPAEAGAETGAERRSVIDFDEDIIEAAPRRPDVVPVVVRPGRLPHKSLIRIRTDFRQEVLSSVARL